ncbi:outer membrane beta-barrel protein [Luteolibacter algae]|uniref:Outer membrane beta-barrel protein n=1 Tax=Luteolibacter algae TaxID=454151 RepID=A0ABW5DBN2_9BACT
MKSRLILMFLAGAFSAQADVLTPVQRFFGMGGQYPDYVDEEANFGEFTTEQAPFSPADSDFGVQEILVKRGSSVPVIFDFETSVYRTDNAPSSSGINDDSSWVSSSSMSLGWRPHLFSGWFADLGLEQDLIRFDNSSATDYENLGLYLGVFKTLPDLDDTIVFARYEYQRLTTGSFTDSDYNAQRVRAGVQKVLWAAPRHQLAASLSGAYEWTATPETLERNEIALDVAYRYAFTDDVYALATASASYYNYDSAGREDWGYDVGVELIWELNKNFMINASVFYDKNDSNSLAGANDFEAWTGGLGLGVRYFF